MVVVAFYDGPKQWPWSLLKQGFGHVCLLRVTGAERPAFIWMEPVCGRLTVDPISQARASRALGRATAVLKVEGHGLSRRPIHGAWGPLYCVGLAKWMLGVQSVWVQTPHQLYRALLARGAEPF